MRIDYGAHDVNDVNDGGEGSAYGRAIRVKSGLGRGLAMVGNTARWSSGLRTGFCTNLTAWWITLGILSRLAFMPQA